jgi:hypothetical protein
VSWHSDSSRRKLIEIIPGGQWYHDLSIGLRRTRPFLFFNQLPVNLT